MQLLGDLPPTFDTKLSMISAKEREAGMSRSNHTEAQMIGALKQLEAGRKAEDVAREVGVSKHTIYAWERRVRRHGCEPRGLAQTCSDMHYHESGCPTLRGFRSVGIRAPDSRRLSQMRPHCRYFLHRAQALMFSDGRCWALRGAAICFCACWGPPSYRICSDFNH